MFPSIDHSLLSPNGRMSKRARKAAIEREAKRLFAGVNFKGEAPKISEYDQLTAQAKNLRELAQRGMSPRKFMKEAERLEALCRTIKPS